MNNLRDIAQKFKILQDITLFENVQMSNRFSFKVGGITPILVEPLNESSFLNVLNLCESEKVPYFILGGGTNIVFSDNGFDGVIISTVKLNKIEKYSEQDEVTLRCECGVLMNTLVNFAVKNCFSGIEEFSGLPGTVGGACYMNARCFNLEMSNVVKRIEYFGIETDSFGNSVFKKKLMEYEKEKWDYKISPFTNTKDIILSVEFSVKKDSEQNREQIRQKASSFMKERIEKGHFKFPCAGSVFKNNRDFGKPTGQIIDELGLKGKSIGGAQVAPWHGNIIINKDNARQKDILDLVQLIKDEAKTTLGFNLEEEIIFK